MLTSSIKNNQLLSFTVPQSEESPLPPLASNELVSYCILQTPSQNILDGKPALFSLMGTQSHNAQVIPYPRNLFLYKAFSLHTVQRKRSALDEIPTVDMTHVRKPPMNPKEIKEHVRDVLAIDLPPVNSEIP